jgi:hypothetical protein
MSRFMKATVFALLILMFFCFMSRIDYTVNGLLYNYGLRFSYDWAIQYWITYGSTFVVFSVILGWAYWFGSNKTTRDLKVSFALVATVNFLALGGLQDIMFFVFWSGGLPPANIVWWWVPWERVLGTWNSLTQISLASLMICSTAFTWRLALKK